jgi:hypothetical protein
MRPCFASRSAPQMPAKSVSKQATATVASVHLADVSESIAIALTVLFSRILAKGVQCQCFLPVGSLQLHVCAAVVHLQPGVKVMVGHDCQQNCGLAG